MKILCICQYYHPEPFRISDICRAFAERGHSVTVVTGIPNYPMGEIYDGYENGKRKNELLDGVEVHRCFTIPRKTGTIRRLLNYYSYPLSSRRFVSSLPDDFDVVLIYQLSPVMMASAGIKYAKRHNKKAILYCLDLWPESLAAGGIERGSFIYKIFHRESKKIYKSVDRIIATSRSFNQYFENEFAIGDVGFLPQYAEDIFTPDECKKQENGVTDLMFAGNVGSAQSIDTIIRAAALCNEDDGIRWHIVGDGSELDRLKKMSEELGAGVIFHGRKMIDKMPEYYAMADAMLITLQSDSAISLTLPGKVQSYMAAGKPIIGAADGETQNVINDSGCGFAGAANDSEALYQNALKLSRLSSAQKQELGEHARKYYEDNYSKNGFIDKLEGLLKDASQQAEQASCNTK